MHRPASDREAIEAEIDRVRSLGLDELRTLWRVTFRSSSPPTFAKDLMARFLCWHIQEQAQGGLDLETAKHLDGPARGAKPGANRPTRLKPGTVLLREYQGERHTVTVVPDGYMWHETTYASLSTIARAITGTAWSGPRFFGLRGGGEPAALSKGADMLLIASNERPSGRAARLTSRPAIAAERPGCNTPPVPSPLVDGERRP